MRRPLPMKQEKNSNMAKLSALVFFSSLNDNDWSL